MINTMNMEKNTTNLEWCSYLDWRYYFMNLVKCNDPGVMPKSLTTYPIGNRI